MQSSHICDIIYLFLRGEFMINVNSFQKIYPFTTENIAGYIENMDVKDKSVLTVGSSSDQVFNSLLLGAKDVTLFDINEMAPLFYQFKKDLILKYDREELYSKVLSNNKFSYFEDNFTKKQLESMNLYLKNDENYYKLREMLKKSNVTFKFGNIYDVSKTLKNEKFDRVILSNVLQYLISENIEDSVSDVYSNLLPYLKSESIVQLYYLYNSLYPRHFSKIMEKLYLRNNDILMQLVTFDGNDSAIFVKRKAK